MSIPQENLESACVKLGIGGYNRHVLLCAGPKCCSPEDGLAAWEMLKQELKQTELGTTCQRTKAGCLRVCCEGPVAVVYPEGTWYHGMTVDKIGRFVKEHLVEGRPVEEWVFAKNPL